MKGFIKLGGQTTLGSDYGFHYVSLTWLEETVDTSFHFFYRGKISLKKIVMKNF